jgi:hypothetical protein
MSKGLSAKSRKLFNANTNTAWNKSKKQSLPSAIATSGTHDISLFYREMKLVIMNNEEK